MFRVSTPSYDTTLQSLSKFLHSLVDRFLGHAVPD